MRMSATANRTPRLSRQSLFYQDLASPIPAPWRESRSDRSDLPPPPFNTLGELSDSYTQSGIQDSSEQHGQHGSASMNWWTPSKSGVVQDDTGRSSPMDGAVHLSALVTLPSPKQVSRPEMQRNTMTAANPQAKEWVTVYGFSAADTNSVLRELEKCGVILKHVPGPRGGNWMHILYESSSDAQKALRKNWMQINGSLIIGVRPVDPIQRHTLNERLINNQGFMTLPPRPYHLQNCNTSARQSRATIASPAKSLEYILYKIMDLMIGV